MALTLTTITPAGRSAWRQLIADVWRYRDLLLTLVERDIRLRYRQTALGILWVILQPLITAGAFAIIFGKIARLPVGDLPYGLFYLAGLVPWICFAQGISAAAVSIESHAAMITKIYFPRILIPAAAVLGTIPDFLIGFLFLNLAATFLGYWSSWLLIVMPALLLLQLITALGIGFFLAALNAQYRDIKHAIPFPGSVWVAAYAGYLCAAYLAAFWGAN